MIDTTCRGCGRSFKIKAYRLRDRPEGVFCSDACRRPPVTVRCGACAAEIRIKPARRLAVNYCSLRCSAQGTGNLKPPAKGERRSPATEFKPGESRTALPVGTTRVWPGASGGTRAWVKVAQPDVWKARAIVVWEAANGPAPSGVVIHHENRHTLDDRLENLTAETRAEHLEEHRPEWESKRRDRAGVARRNNRERQTHV